MKPQVTEAHRAAAIDYCLQYGWNPDAQPEVAAMLAEHDAELLARAEAAEAAFHKLSDEAKCYLESRDALDNWEHDGPNREDYLKLRERNGNAREYLESSLAPAETRSVIAGLREEIIAINARFLGAQDRLNQQVDKCSKLEAQRDALIAAAGKSEAAIDEMLSAYSVFSGIDDWRSLSRLEARSIESRWGRAQGKAREAAQHIRSTIDAAHKGST